MSGRHIDKTPSSIEFSNRISHLKTDRFKFSNRLPKSLSPITEPGGNLQTAPGHTKCSGCRGQPLGNHHSIEDPCPSMEWTQKILGRHFGITKIGPACS